VIPVQVLSVPLHLVSDRPWCVQANYKAVKAAALTTHLKNANILCDSYNRRGKRVEIRPNSTWKRVEEIKSALYQACTRPPSSLTTFWSWASLSPFYKRKNWVSGELLLYLRLSDQEMVEPEFELQLESMVLPLHHTAATQRPWL